MAKVLIEMDPGHGGKDPGGGTNKLFKEKDLVLQISLYQLQRCKELGIPAGITRATDETLTNEERIRRVKESGAKICLCNHINNLDGDPNNAANPCGVETWYSIHDDKSLAERILKYIGAAGMPMRKASQKTGTKFTNIDYYFMIRETRPVQTVITEYGFADNTEDTKRLMAHWKEYAEAALKAAVEELGLPYKPPEQKKPQQATKPQTTQNSAATAMLNTSTSTYTIKPGDTLYKIAVNNKTTAAQLIKINGIKDPGTIQPGQKIKLK